jgi:glycosyltransferase involved in cell wall biosynthesis
MNILHLTKDYQYLNGITTFIKFLSLNDNLNKHFIASNYITIDNENNQSQNIIRHVLPVDAFQFVKNIKQVVSICKENKIDIIHSHHRYYDLLAYIVSKFIEIKTVTTVHSKVFGKKLISYKADNIVAVGESIKSHLIDYFGIDEKRITVINNFIDPNAIKITKDAKEIKNELRIGGSKFIIGFAGRFDIKEKGIDILLKVSADIIDKNKNVIFIFIGDGVDKDYLINETRNFKENFRIVETKNDIYNYMQIFDLFVLPSRIDPFPLVMLEAAYLQIPFIGSNVDGIAEFVNNNVNGLLFAPENVKELISKISALIYNIDKRTKLAENLHRKVMGKFTADVIIPQYDILYETLLTE